MNFGDEVQDDKKKGWATFLDFIQRYPVTQKAQKIVEDIKKEKVAYLYNVFL